jgi:fructuronate reductase
LQHRTMQIAMDGSVKIPQRILGTLLARLDKGLPVPRLALALAAWLHFLRGQSDSGESYSIDDPKAARLVGLARDAAALASPVERAEFWLQQEDVLGHLGKYSALKDALAQSFERLEGLGAQAAI